ncbi:MAG: ribokinase [Acidimicrobiia bacterium]|nr:ribokinase [Acidimicrobiia bacterium]
MARIGVVGSVNLDMIATAPRLPKPGETVTDATFAIHPGGKGANQALAARRLGAEVSLIARVGTDSNSGPALELLRRDGVDLDRAYRDREHPTGVALIVVDEAGENQITVAPGANRHLEPADLDLSGFDAVVAQLEVPIDTVMTAATTAAESLFVLNAAPVRTLPADLIGACDVIIVNEGEHAALADVLTGADAIVVTTLGPRGARAQRGSEEIGHASAPTVNAIDTVGAGDAFTAALTVALCEGREISDALAWACGAGALTATRRGAQPALPTRTELDDFMANL